MTFIKTPIVAEILGVRYSHLIELLRSKRLTPPAKDSSGDYVWMEADLERARQALAAGRVKRAATSA